MIEILVDEETQNECLKMNYTEEDMKALERALGGKPLEIKNLSDVNYDIAKELHTINVTLKEILRKMKKRKV